MSDRRVLDVILFVLTSGCLWRALPIEMGFGSGVSRLSHDRRFEGEVHEVADVSVQPARDQLLRWGYGHRRAEGLNPRRWIRGKA